MSNIDIPYAGFETSIQQSLRDLENLNSVLAQIDSNFKAVVSNGCWEGTLRNRFVEKYNELSKCVSAIGVNNLEQSVASKVFTVQEFTNTEATNRGQY